MKTVLIVTEKPFSKAAVDGITKILNEKGHEVKLLEKYTDPAQIYEAAANADAMIVRSDLVTQEVLEHAPKLKIVVRAGAGYDNIDLQAATEKGIIVENTPGQNANAVAELVFGLMLLYARKNFSGASGTELAGKKIGIQGYGAVGRNVARIANGFNMDIYTLDTDPQRPRPDDELTIRAGIKTIKKLPELYQICQYLSLHIPANAETKGSINYELLSNLPKGGVLVNTARAEIIDEDGLLEMFEKREDFGYLSDVAPKNKDLIAEKFPGRFFFTQKKAGAQTAEANNNAGLAAANQISSFFETGKSTFQVNR